MSHGRFVRGSPSDAFRMPTCIGLLKIHETVAAAHPGLDKLELYRQIVTARLGGTQAAADAILARAAESFATWPVERAEVP
jgi:hypothetical protein